MNWRLLAAGTFVCIAASAGQSTMTINVRTVAITAVVRDKHGALITDLKKEDFTLKEDGAPQTIQYFAEDPDLPLQLGLLVDTSSSEREYLDEIRGAGDVFLTTVLQRKNDRGFLVQFDYNILLKQSMTSDIAALENGLARMDERHQSAENRHGGTLLFDAVVGTMETVTRFVSGRRAIVIISDGEDNGSVHNVDDAVHWAQLADTSVYTILYGHDDCSLCADKYAPHKSGHGAMYYLASSTGGHFFKVSKKMPIETIYAEIQHELRSQYRFGYTPPSSKPMQYHHIDLTTSRRGATIQARTAYITPKD